MRFSHPPRVQESERILRALADSRWNYRRAAVNLRVDYRWLLRRLHLPDIAPRLDEAKLNDWRCRIVAALEQADGQETKATASLGIALKTLKSKIRALDLGSYAETLRASYSERERQEMIAALTQANFNQRKAAALLNVRYTHLLYRMGILGIRIHELRRLAAEQQAQEIIAALNRTDWHRKKAAALLRISYSRLRYLMKKLEIIRLAESR